MRKFSTFFILLSVTTFFKAQFDQLPENLIPYKGGTVQFYKDLNNVLIENNLKPCNNRPSEMFLAKIEIDEQNVAKIINKNPQANDCSKELFVNAFNEINKLGNWKYISESKGKTSVLFYPMDYFDNFKEGYTVAGLQEDATFPGGTEEFRKKFLENFLKINTENSQNINYQIKFKISAQGEMYNIKISSENPDSEIERNIVLALQEVKTKWSPAKFRGLSLISNHQMSFKF